MFAINAGYFLMQVASEKDKKYVYKLCGKYSREDANGVAQICFVGVINPLCRRVETPQEVRDSLLLASKHIPRERLGSTDDCGFLLSVWMKPKHGSPDIAREIAFKKIASRVEGTSDGFGEARHGIEIRVILDSLEIRSGILLDSPKRGNVPGINRRLYFCGLILSLPAGYAQDVSYRITPLRPVEELRAEALEAHRRANKDLFANPSWWNW